MPPALPALLRRRLVVLVAATALLGGCATPWRSTEAERLDPAERATVVVAADRLAVTIVRVDAQPLGPRPVTRIEVAPGDHVIAANVPVSSPPIILEFKAEAGHRYTLKPSIVDGVPEVFHWTAEIQDDATGRVVSKQGGASPGKIRAMN